MFDEAEGKGIGDALTLELDEERFLECAGEDAGRVKGLKDGEEGIEMGCGMGREEKSPVIEMGNAFLGELLLSWVLDCFFDLEGEVFVESWDGRGIGERGGGVPIGEEFEEGIFFDFLLDEEREFDLGHLENF